MEQVDQIIIETLRELGVDIPGSVSFLGNLPDHLIVKSVARTLNVIRGGSLPETLPGNMALRYRVGIELANACKDLGLVMLFGLGTIRSG